MKRSTRPVWTIFTLTALFLIVGCGVQAEISEEELVVAQSGEPVSLDPHASNDNRSALVVHQIYETLVRQDEDLELYPGLAESWEKVDDRVYQFVLRQDVYFHNGEPLQASDVEFSMLRAANSPTAAPVLGEIDPDTIEIINESTIRIGTYEPFSPLLAHLAHPSASILNEESVHVYGDSFGQNPVGTGPFTFEKWAQGNEIELLRNTNYHGDLAGVEKLTIRNISETANRLIELETGQVDIALDLAPSDITRAEKHEHLSLIREPNLRTHYIGFNTQQEPFDDVRIRQAINYAVNTDLIIETILEGSGIPAKGPIASRVWGAHQDLEIYEYNLERAVILLEEAGFANGFTTTILTDDDTLRMNIATALRKQLEVVGIDASIEPLEWATFLEATSNREHEIFIMGWTAVTADADYGLYPLFHSSQFGSGGNRAFYDNQRVDQLLEAARVEQNEAVRLAYYLEAQEIIIEDAPWIFLNVGEAVIGLRENINGFRANPNGHHYFSKVYLD